MNISEKYINRLDLIYDDAVMDGNDIKDENQENFLAEIEFILKEYRSEIEKLSNVLFVENKKYICNLNGLSDLLDEICFQETTNDNLGENKSWKTSAINRLHIMLIKTVREFTYLLNGGYANASFSRLRAIYEIIVYYKIINANNDDISERFLKHSNAHRIKFAKSLDDTQLLNKVKTELNNFDFEERFEKENQWAFPLINAKQIQFIDLVKLANMEDTYSIYIYACSSVHASVYTSANGIDIASNLDKSVQWNTGNSKEGIKLAYISFLQLIEQVIFEIKLHKLNSLVLALYVKTIFDEVTELTKK